MDLYNNAVDGAIPWAKLKKLDQSGSEFSKKSANLIGKITTQLLNANDAYFMASQSIYEWCGVASSTLKRYINFSKIPNPALKTAQQGILVNAHKNGIKHMTNGNEYYEKSLSALHSASEELKALLAQLEVDYDPNGEWFKKRVASISKANGGTFGFFKNKEKLEKEAIEQLTAETKPIQEFYENASVEIENAIINLAQTMPKLESKIHIMKDILPQLSASSDTAAPGQKEAIIQSAQALIERCEEFRQRHE